MRLDMSGMRRVGRLVLAVGIALATPAMLSSNGLVMNDASADEALCAASQYTSSKCYFMYTQPEGNIHHVVNGSYCQWYNELNCETCCPSDGGSCEVGSGYQSEWGDCDSGSGPGGGGAGPISLRPARLLG